MISVKVSLDDLLEDYEFIKKERDIMKNKESIKETILKHCIYYKYDINKTVEENLELLQKKLKEDNEKEKNKINRGEL